MFYGGTFNTVISILALILGIFSIVVAVVAYMKKKDKRGSDDLSEH